MLYLWIKWLHILSAIAALGANLTYSAWLGLAEKEPEALAFALRGIHALEDRIANRGYGALLITGILLIYLGHLPLTTPWLLTALILYAATAMAGILAYSPALRKQIELAEREGPGSETYQQAARRSNLIGLTMILVVVVIVFLMVVKPALWG